MLWLAAGTAPVMTTDESASSKNETSADETQDRNSSTGTTSNDPPVGRASGDETADAEESGGERRSGRPQDARDGALRDE
jgi:hypothetical protein